MTVPLELGVNCLFPEVPPDWFVCYLHEWHMQIHNILRPRPLGPWGRAKSSNIIKSQLQRQFQRFFNQALCVFSQMKDIKHIRRDFHSVVRVMPQGLALGGTMRGLGSNLFSKIRPDLMCELLT